MNNVYGITKPSLVDPSRDVEIYYSYRPNRNSDNNESTPFKKLDDVSSLFTNAVLEENETPFGNDNRLPGMYNLQLPVDRFGEIGYYTIYIKPKEYKAKILDVGTLSAYPDIKGIVIDLTQNLDVDTSFFSNDSLVGYRIEYADNNEKRTDYFRFITSNTRCEPVSQNLTSANTSSNGYRYTESGTLCFLTVTPSTAPSYKSNQKPYIGAPNQNIVITNTKFDPIMIEVQIVKHDDETISTMLEGNQIRSLDRGLVTTYNDKGEVYIQHEYFSAKDNYTSDDVYEVKKNRSDNVDFTANYDGLINNK